MSHRLRQERWWDEGGPNRRASNQVGARRYHARRKRQVLQVRAGHSPSWWPWLRRALVVVALLGPILTLRYGGQWKNQYAAWKAARETAQVVQSLDKAGDTDAILQLLPMLQRHPAQPEVLRRLAWAASAEHPYQSITLFYRLRDLGQASFEDRLQLGRLLVKTDRPSLAQDVYAQLMQELPAAPEPWIECGHAASQVGDLMKAETSFQQALNLAPDSAPALIALSQLNHWGPPSRQVKPFSDRLLSLAASSAKQGDHQQTTAILLALSELPQLSSSQKSRFIALTETQPDGPIEARLACHSMKAPAHLTDAARSQLHQHWADELTPLETAERCRGLRWIQNLGDHDFVLAQTADPCIYESGPLLTLRLLSLLAHQRIEEASRLMAHPKASFAQVQPQILAAFESFRSQPPPALGAVLKRLFQETDPALQQTEACYVMGILGLQAGAPDLALAALTRALEIAPRWPLPAQPLLIAARKTGRDSSQLLESLCKVSRLPISIALRQRLAYLKLLANQELMATEAEIASLLQHFPSDPFLRMLAALSHYKRGDFAAAVKGLLPLPKHQWHQGETAVIVSILASGGLAHQTSALLAAIKKSHLLREEKELVAPWLDKLTLRDAFAGEALLSQEAGSIVGPMAAADSPSAISVLRLSSTLPTHPSR